MWEERGGTRCSLLSFAAAAVALSTAAMMEGDNHCADYFAVSQNRVTPICCGPPYSGNPPKGS